MEVIVSTDYEELSDRAAAIVAGVLERKPEALLVLPTGETPVGMYARLATLQREQQLDFSRALIFALDEWGGLGRHHPLSCHQAIVEAFIQPAGIAAASFQSLGGDAPDLEAECRRYSQALASAGPIDLAVLGIGANGHVGFNEPAEALPAETYVAQLAAETVARARERMSGIEAPKIGLTLGMAQIMSARQVMVLASGGRKGEAWRRLLRGPVTTWFPASLLRLHRAVIAIVDQEAAFLDRQAPTVLGL